MTCSAWRRSKNLGSQFLLGLFVFQRVIPAHQEGMGHRHNGALLALTRGEVAKAGRERSRLGVRRRPGRLTQAAPQSRTAFARFARQTLAGTLVVPRTDPGPTAEVVRGRKLFQVHVELGDQVGGGHLCDPRDGGFQG